MPRRGAWTYALASPLAVLLAAAPDSPPPGLRFVSAKQHATLQQALDRESALYVPPGRHVLEQGLVLEGREEVVILGGGRADEGTILELRGRSGIRVGRCRRLTLANLWIDARGLAPGSAALELVGEGPGSLQLINVLILGGVVDPSHVEGGLVGLRVAAPADVWIQGSHFTGCGAGVLIDHPGARVRVLGGNFQRQGVHIRQVAGDLEAYGVGFQIAFGGADIELNRAGRGPFVVAGCRTEGPGHLVRTPETHEALDVIVKACSVPGKLPFVRYGGAGALTLLGNNAARGIEAEGATGVVWSVGNRLGSAADEAGPYRIGPRARGFAAADLWDTGTEAEPVNALITPGELRRRGRAVPSSLRFLADGDAIPPTRGARREAAPMPVVSNIAELIPSVRDHGAAGDGRTDDTETLQRAIDAHRNRPLFFPAGRYRITRSLVLDHASGGWWVGAGMDRTTIVNTAGGGVVRTDGCGYATFQDMAFEAAVGGEAPVFDLSWRGGTGPLRAYGAALQANAFHRCRFVGGSFGLLIGREGFMGSESLLVGCEFLRSGVGLGVANFNALTNNVVGCLFGGNGVAVAQADAGSFNVFSSRFEESREADLVLKNSAGDAFYLSDVTSSSPVLLKTTNTGAGIHALLEGLLWRGRGPAPIASYAAGGSLVFLEGDLGDGVVSAGGAIAHKAVVLAGARARSRRPLQMTERARGLVLRGSR